ncbi:hypothetical protein HHO41_21930 [Bacillus sp. DNRA2]|uniref:hypothetical protein n=1 Tax=Bacillus sp. DNRA2 TaxID=2723053 RepID=UPI00145D0696|nr:hypothetical protein [Bacillus sp. DNRA2]NMD72878.1 hypothetical protein [Bacillus sp. DNRA2]
MDFNIIKRFIISELNEKAGIREEEIGLLDSGNFDLVDEILEFDFGLRNDDFIYAFWHDYRYNVGKITRYKSVNNSEKDEEYKYWGDWEVYQS